MNSWCHPTVCTKLCMPWPMRSTTWSTVNLDKDRSMEEMNVLTSPALSHGRQVHVYRCEWMQSLYDFVGDQDDDLSLFHSWCTTWKTWISKYHTQTKRSTSTMEMSKPTMTSLTGRSMVMGKYPTSLWDTTMAQWHLRTGWPSWMTPLCGTMKFWRFVAFPFRVYANVEQTCFSIYFCCAYVCCSHLDQCAVRTASQAPGRA